MQSINIENITIDKLSISLCVEKKIALSVLRLDKIHPVISGNKWFKLRHYLEDVKAKGKKTIVTFGGAWSNHILATAAASKLSGLNSIGLIRGEEVDSLSTTLSHAKQLGMQLIFLNRQDYKQKIIPLAIKNSDYYFIDEGGFGKYGASGAATILTDRDIDSFSHICCAGGTGTMAAGLLNGISKEQKLIVVSVLKNYSDMESKIKEIAVHDAENMTVNHDYHFGGYGKYKPELLAFMNEFYQQTAVPTDFVYTGKLSYAIIDLIKKGYFPEGSNLLLIHSGGLQGNASLSKGTLIF